MDALTVVQNFFVLCGFGLIGWGLWMIIKAIIKSLWVTYITLPRARMKVKDVAVKVKINGVWQTMAEPTIINCRCTAAPILSGGGYVFPNDEPQKNTRVGPVEIIDASHQKITQRVTVSAGDLIKVNGELHVVSG